MKRMSEHLLNDYASEARRDGKLSAGKVANLLNEAWRARSEADGLRSRLGRAQEERAKALGALKMLLEAFPPCGSEQETNAVEAAGAVLREAQK